ncbi:ribosome quality control complex subunit NEMF homolog [Phlebotomus argentipes]|uniref:ribosome quality control complex subunit NEMF homolog n=1 Tax=Phlebotomus argentipes TaxID=94469 RepID=UPI002892BD74|nr:ribosome quality control complex subunit NEMF homolog [Phlebotomus argentipes]
MKTRFNTYDIVCIVTELQKLIGMRVNQIYDIDNRTYLIRLQRTEEKVVLLLESGNRLHTTAFEWPKNVAPSGFTMKLRKHLKNKRLESLTQVGCDRIVNLQFGTGEAAYHVILELYDRGNVLLCDYEMTILNVLRPHAEGEEVRFVVREKYPLQRAKQNTGPISEAAIREGIENAQAGTALRNVLNPLLNCGPSVIDHVLLKRDLLACKVRGKKAEEGEQPAETGKKRKQKQKDTAKYGSKEFSLDSDMTNLMEAVVEAQEMMEKASSAPSKGFVIQKEEKRPTQSGEEESFFVNVEYHPFPFQQFNDRPCKEFESFDASVDEFHSTLEGQKIDLKAMQQERDAMKKLTNVRTDHAKRLEELTKNQLVDRDRAELITRNQELVDKAIYVIQSALANQLAWPEIQEMVKTAQAEQNPVALIIKQLKLEVNSISLQLSDPYSNLEEDSDEEDNDDEDRERLEPMVVDVDLCLSAFANARKYYDQKRIAARKEQKTIESSGKALKSAERRTHQTLKEVKTMTNISKARKVYWFEKFYWFISSENYLVIGGRDQQQNEMIVKRYMRPTDIYVHAEIQGASSVVIRNPSGNEVPPKTLLEAGTMAISYSVAWDAKVVTSAYWVKSDQVSKTAPTGEYLGTGSFMIRGKKNFLPPCQLVLGMSFMFRLEDSSVERHRGERRVRQFGEDDDGSLSRQTSVDTEKLSTVSEEVEIDLEKDDDENGKSSSDSDDESGVKYPDTHVKIDHDTGRVTLKSDALMERLTSIEEKPENTIYLGDDKPYIIPADPRPSKKKQQKKKGKEPIIEEQPESKTQSDEEDSRGDGKLGQMKRGQKGKLKKMKKYKDQDEDERKQRMEILKSDGRGAKEKKKKAQEEELKKFNRRNVAARKPREPVEGEELDETPAAADVDMLDFLTGAPVEEDELLFAVPVIAPYQTLHNYKFKVKLTPGTGRRGKASKMAVMIFQKDKNCTNREKDLLRSVKEEMIARNIPGKVKLSAPQLQKFKK